MTLIRLWESHVVGTEFQVRSSSLPIAMLLSQGTSSEIPRIRRDVREVLEVVILPHHDLPSNMRIDMCTEAFGNVGDAPCVACHILTSDPIPSSRRTNEAPAPVFEAQCRTVQLRLTQDATGPSGGEEPFDARLIDGLLQGTHREQVLHLR